MDFVHSLPTIWFINPELGEIFFSRRSWQSCKSWWDKRTECMERASSPLLTKETILGLKQGATMEQNYPNNINKLPRCSCSCFLFFLGLNLQFLGVDVGNCVYTEMWFHNFLVSILLSLLRCSYVCCIQISFLLLHTRNVKRALTKHHAHSIAGIFGLSSSTAPISNGIRKGNSTPRSLKTRPHTPRSHFKTWPTLTHCWHSTHYVHRRHPGTRIRTVYFASRL